MDVSGAERLLQESWALYSNGKLKEALKKVDEALELQPTGHAYWQQAVILWALKKPDEAVKKLREAIDSGYEDYPLHDYLTDLLFSLLRYDEALDENTKTLQALEAQTVATEKFQEALTGPASAKTALSYVEQRTRMVVRGTQIVNMKLMSGMSMDIAKQITAVQGQVDKERTRTIELLGLFAAILAFVFSSVQIVSHVEFPAGYTLMIGTGLVLFVFLLGLHFVLEPERRSLPAQGLFALSIVALLLLPWYGRIVARSFPPPTPKAEILAPAGTPTPTMAPAAVIQPSPMPTAAVTQPSPMPTAAP
jgi:tetratricopeptide (TPR) repeat protein